MQLDAKTGFFIGQDYALYFRAAPHFLHDYKDVMAGFHAAQGKVKIKEPDRYIKKWLQLRLSAWRRNRVIDDDVTPSYIEYIDSGRCPVSNIILTHATQDETDWSVDRINNDAAYVRGNLVVVSARANMLKDTLGFHEIFNLAYVCDDTVSPVTLENLKPLTHFEWAAWASITSKVIVGDQSKLCYVPCPCVIFPPLGSTINPSDCLQCLIAVRAYAPHLAAQCYAKVQKLLSMQQRSALAELVKRAERMHRKGTVMLDCWHNFSLFTRFVAFFESLPVDVACQCVYEIMPYIANLLGDSSYTTDTSRWAINTGGYCHA